MHFTVGEVGIEILLRNASDDEMNISVRLAYML